MNKIKAGDKVQFATPMKFNISSWSDGIVVKVTNSGALIQGTGACSHYGKVRRSFKNIRQITN